MSVSPWPPTRPWRAYFCLAASMTLVGSYVGLSKLLLAVFPVFLLAWLRFGIAAVAMAGWVRRGPREPALDARERRLLFWQSFLGNFLFSVCMLFGVSFASALAAGVVMAALPATVALLSWGWLGERIGAAVWAGVACAAAGIALVALGRAGDGAADGHAPLLGSVLLLLAVVCEASYVVIGKRLAGRLTARRVSALVNLWGLALITPLGLWQALAFDFGAVAPASWALLVFYSLAASMVAVWLWMTGLAHVPAASAGVFTVLLPLAAGAVGVLLLGERFSLPQGLALAFALIGLLLATWPRHRDQAAQNV